MRPLVSVIVPVHNQEKYLGRCLRSLIAQDMPRDEYEIVVIDDGSTDRSAYALELFADELQIVSLPLNGGLPAAINVGLKQARADFVVRVDADDYVNSRFLSVLHLFLESNNNLDAVACDYILVDNGEMVLGRGNVDHEPIACGIMFRLSQLRELGLYDESFLAHEDLDLRHRFLQRHAIERIPLPLYRYRRHDANMTNDAEHLARFQRLLEEKHELNGEES
jgi:glycosyltransferase involved in cell wall biosynthesis